MKMQIPIIWHKSIDSTNSEARRRMDSLDKMSVYAAEYQTAGRGQRGNRWSSAAGENLTFSILLHPGRSGIPAIDVSNQFILSIISALAVSDFIMAKGIGCRIKWPNDIYIRNRKVCGMLIENILKDNIISASIIGIGLNLNQREFPPEIANPTSLRLAGCPKLSPQDALNEIMGLFQRRLQAMPDGQEEMTAGYVSRLYRKDCPHQYRDCATEEVFTGTIRGIAGDGRLLMEMLDGTVRLFSFKELSYII